MTWLGIARAPGCPSSSWCATPRGRCRPAGRSWRPRSVRLSRQDEIGMRGVESSSRSCDAESRKKQECSSTHSTGAPVGARRRRPARSRRRRPRRGPSTNRHTCRIDVAALRQPLPQRPRRWLVARLGGADEVVVAAVDGGRQVAETLRDPIGEGPAGRGRRGAAAFSTFWPCSSVPVRKCTLRPSRRMKRASASQASVV